MCFLLRITWDHHVVRCGTASDRPGIHQRRHIYGEYVKFGGALRQGTIRLLSTGRRIVIVARILVTASIDIEGPLPLGDLIYGPVGNQRGPRVLFLINRGITLLRSDNDGRSVHTYFDCLASWMIGLRVPR